MLLTYYNLLFHLQLVKLFQWFMWPAMKTKYTVMSFNCGLINAKISASVIVNEN